MELAAKVEEMDIHCFMPCPEQMSGDRCPCLRRMDREIEAKIQKSMDDCLTIYAGAAILSHRAQQAL